MRRAATCALWLWALALPLEASAQSEVRHCLPATAAPELERIMEEHDVESHLGSGWIYGDAQISPDMVTIPVLHDEEPAALITLTRPRTGETGRWFSHEVWVVRPASPQIETALIEVADRIDRGFARTPWTAECGRAGSGEIVCGFCGPQTRDWPLHMTRRPWIPLLLGALVALSILLGIVVALGHMGAQIRRAG